MLFIFTIQRRGEKVSLCVWVPWELMSGVGVPSTRALPAGTGRLGLRLERGSPLQTEVCLLSHPSSVFFPFAFRDLVCMELRHGALLPATLSGPSSIEGGGVGAHAT